MYKLETSFTDISGSNGPILMKFIQLFQPGYIESKYKFSRGFNYFTESFNIEL